jgi:hypothetical protein
MAGLRRATRHALGQNNQASSNGGRVIVFKPRVESANRVGQPNSGSKCCAGWASMRLLLNRQVESPLLPGGD